MENSNATTKKKPYVNVKKLNLKNVLILVCLYTLSMAIYKYTNGSKSCNTLTHGKNVLSGYNMQNNRNKKQ